MNKEYFEKSVKSFILTFGNIDIIKLDKETNNNLNDLMWHCYCKGIESAMELIQEDSKRFIKGLNKYNENRKNE